MSAISPFVNTLILLRSELTLVLSLHICAFIEENYPFPVKTQENWLLIICFEIWWSNISCKNYEKDLT